LGLQKEVRLEGWFGWVWEGSGGFLKMLLVKRKSRPEDGPYEFKQVFQKSASTLFFIFLFPNNQKHFPAETPRFRDFGKSSLI